MANIQSGSDSGAREALTPGTRARLNTLDWVALVLLVIGGLNWGLLGLFGIDVVARLLGDMTTVARAVYVLVGIAAVYAIYLCAGKLPAKP